MNSLNPKVQIAPRPFQTTRSQSLHHIFPSNWKTMNTPNHNTSMQSLCRLALGHGLSFALLLLLALAPSAAQAQPVPTPPERMACQGFLADGSGNPLAATAPKNYDVVFRIWNDQSATGAANRLWTEQQTVTVDKGNFSVMLGEGSPYSNEPRPNLSGVFAGLDASERYVEFTVRGIGAGGADVTILPRLKVLSAPYAFMARNATALTSPNGATLVTAANGQLTVNGTIAGDASGLTNLNAGQLSSGSLPGARLSGTYANALTLNNAGNLFTGQFTGQFTGNGSGLNTLNAANLTGPVPAGSLTSIPAGSLTGTIDDARLSGNVARLNAVNNFAANVGINTIAPTATLDVNGSIKATNVTVNGTVTATTFDGVFNGEKPPYVIEVGTKDNTLLYHAKEVSSDIIKSYLGDTNGGTVRILLRVNSTDDVRISQAIIYIEQPDKSGSFNEGLSGFTHQSYSSEYHSDAWRASSLTAFILGKAADAKYELITPVAWNWIWMRNYNTGGLPGLPPASGPAFTGADQYKVEFVTAPNISATIFIYDR